MELNPCHNDLGSLFKCDVQQQCEAGYVKSSCTNDIFTSGLISEEDIRTLEDDCYEEGYCLIPVEAHFVILNKHDAEMDIIRTKDSGDKDHYRKSWYDTVKEHRGIFPQPFTKQVSNNYDLRASEHGHDLARIIAKLDKERLKNDYGIDLENKYSQAGTAAHLLRNHQDEEMLVHNERLREIGIEPISRRLYCEMPLKLTISHKFKIRGPPDEITIKGHPDVLFQFGDNHALGALDFKRAKHIPYERRSHVRQKLIYAMALAQQLGEEPEYFYGLTTNRPFEADMGNYRDPKYRLVRVPNVKDNAQLIEMHSELARSYLEQAFILQSKSSFQKAYETLHLEEFCRPAADFFAERMKTEPGSFIDLLDDLELIASGYEPASI